MAEGPARLIIPFKDMDALRNYVGALREDPPTQTQPFGGDVNAVVYQPAEDDLPPHPDNVAILVPGFRADQLAASLLLPVPGEPPEPRASRPRLRQQPDQLFAPHGTPGGPVPPSAGHKSGLDEPAPY
jgi:hypothetical protein